ncbi:MAG TPA: glycoside hydrolase family 130 protein [Acidimicrobiia bacterium]|jgi:predicted GH43/DUF377 family glycosyl hydrolase|nr:glycoside hydrolase family 130 protein [Acidimicrobiia bacterium]
MVKVTRSDLQITPDPHRVVARPFLPGEPAFAGGPSRVEMIANRVLTLTDSEAEDLLAETKASFAGRHPDLARIWHQNASWAETMVPSLANVESGRRDLLGAFFTQEYAPEAVAVCNPSMVPAPNADDGRFIMSIRAIGEGHISSVEFRTGSVDDHGTVTVDAPDRFLSIGDRRSPSYDKEVFTHKLLALNADAALVERVMTQLPDRFTARELDTALEILERVEAAPASVFETRKLIHWMSASNYELAYRGEEPISERILLPSSPAESRGIEDARFVRFTEADGTVSYYATYTAYDGYTILPQLIETDDFSAFRFATLNGSCARNKGMALFPRRVGGFYAALGRHDQENLHLLRSDQLRVWNHAELITSPTQGWETVQIGTCGSPIETDQGWLVLTHGVGPMRRYALGVFLLDLDDPSRLIGRLKSPLLEPGSDERDGYVPNVVYSCGAMLHEDWLIIPYGFADEGIHLAKVSVAELLHEMS